MPNIASVLKDEIARLARKELRGDTGGLKKASAHYRAEIAALKRRVLALEQVVARLTKTARREAETAEAKPSGTRLRYTAKGLHAQRQRLGLSAAELGLLLDVSAQTVYNWEAETTRPREKQIVAIAALRGLGKRQANARLQELAAQAE